MVFSSLTFLFFFLPIVLLIYYISPAKVKNMVILISGILFYAWGEPFYIIIMLLSTAIDYTAGRFIDFYDKDEKKRKIFLLVSVCMNLGLLSVFKYSSFIIGNINGLLGTELFDPQLPLPIGISFYTFQSMSYTIDLYFRKIKVQKNIISFTSFVTLFPQIVAGPIVRYEDIANEIDDRRITISDVGSGASIFIKGLAKKVLLANNIGLVWTEIKAMDYSVMPAMTAWIGILAFTFQIYFDFSGYSDMAVGLGKMLGFTFPQNFNHPYISKSVSEFWRRWHITLGSWFRSYVYIPMGGNRNGKGRTLINLLVVWALTGLWHGSSWNFILWGLYFGIIIILERIGLSKLLEKLPSFVRIAYTFILVVFGWVLFETASLTDAADYFGAMFGAGGMAADGYSIYLLLTNAVVFLLCVFASGELADKIRGKLSGKFPSAYSCGVPVVQTVLLLVCTAFLVDATYNPFLYFRF